MTNLIVYFLSLARELSLSVGCVRAQFIIATTQKKGPEWNAKTDEWEAELLGAYSV